MKGSRREEKWGGTVRRRVRSRSGEKKWGAEMGRRSGEEKWEEELRRRSEE